MRRIVGIAPDIAISNAISDYVARQDAPLRIAFKNRLKWAPGTHRIFDYSRVVGNPETTCFGAICVLG